MGNTNINWVELSDSSIVAQIGNFVKKNRLQQNITQAKLAEIRITSYNVCYTKLLRKMYDVKGQLIRFIGGSDVNGSVNCMDLSPGVYLIWIFTEHSVIRNKIIKK